MKSSAKKIELASVDDLFSTEESRQDEQLEKIQEIPLKGNVDATFACLAAMDGADTASTYARFNCTVRYNAASDEYIVVVLYG